MDLSAAKREVCATHVSLLRHLRKPRQQNDAVTLFALPLKVFLNSFHGACKPVLCMSINLANELHEVFDDDNWTFLESKSIDCQQLQRADDAHDVKFFARKQICSLRSSVN